MEMVRLWDSNVPLGKRIVPDRIELSLGANEVDGKADLVLALVAGKSRVTYVAGDLDPGDVLRLAKGPTSELVLELGK